LRAGVRARDPSQEFRVILESVVEPVVFGLEPDEDSGRLAVARAAGALNHHNDEGRAMTLAAGSRLGPYEILIRRKYRPPRQM
jgi:hypothetical protein